MDDNTLKPFSVYLMENEQSWYVGSAYNLTTPQDRYGRHLSGRGGATKLWEAIQRGETFTQSILDSGECEDVHGAYCVEEQWIHKYLADDPRECLNVNLYPSRRSGWKESPESIARRSENNRGKPNQANHERLIGQPRPDLVEAWARPGARERRSAAVRAGMAAMSDEDRAQMTARQRRPKQARATHCGYGHEFTPENTYVAPNGRRQCRTCNAIRAAYKKAGTPDPRVRVLTPKIKTHCAEGHELTPENTYVVPGTGLPTCRQCRKDGDKRRAARR